MYSHSLLIKTGLLIFAKTEAQIPSETVISGSEPGLQQLDQPLYKLKMNITPKTISNLFSLFTPTCLVCAGLILGAVSAQTGFALTARKASKSIEGQITTAQKAQKKIERWESDKAVILSDIRDMKVRSLWLDFQQEKHRNYLNKQQAVIDELKQKKIEARKIRMELEPFLEQLVYKLEAQVNDDLPFLMKERRERIAFLKESLADYHLDLSEKLRRVLEALRIEAEYGRTVERTEQMLKLNGAPSKVIVLRIGRIGLFFRSQEGKYIGRWNKQKGSWEMLPASYASVLADASEMASGKRAVELLNLPLGKIQR